MVHFDDEDDSIVVLDVKRLGIERGYIVDTKFAHTALNLYYNLSQ